MRSKKLSCLLLPLLILAHQSVRAVDRLEFAAAEVSGEGWHASDLKLATRLNQDDTLALDVRSSMLKLASADQNIEDIHWQCERLEQIDADFACKQSRLTLGKSPLGAVRMTLDWQFEDSQNWQLSLHQLDTDAGNLRGSLSMEQGQWQAHISSRLIQLEKLVRLLPESSMTGWSLSGVGSFKAGISGYQGELHKLSLELKGRQIAYSDAEGLQAGENVALQLDMNAALLSDQWTGVVDLSIEQGQLYSDPVYLAVDKQPLDFHTRFKGQPQQAQLQLHDARLKLPGVVTASIKAHLQQGQWSRLAIQFKAPDLAGFYKVLAQPFLIGSALDELSVQGSGEGYLSLLDDELIALDMKLKQLDVEDAQGRFGIRQLNTELHWLTQGQAPLSMLSMAGGHLFNIDFGQVQANMLVRDGQLLVKQKISMPLLGGELSLNNLVLDGLTQAPVKWQLAMSAKQIQLEALSKALEWPLLSGQLDGHIPSVQYADGNVVLDGELTVDVFGGRIIVDGLQVVDPMDVAPVLETRLKLQDLDLAQLTNTFSFGRIEGLLAGEIDELQLVGWQLNRFKAGIRTPENDKSRRRISQRAIDNLTSLGTGVSAGLSGTALRMFKDFAYDKIALEVDLAGNMARLDGIPYKDDGYYIVKGAGLPRIDVIGRTHRIAWKDLLSRIQDARFDDMVIE